MTVTLHPSAALELEEQANWYDARVAGLGDRYYADFHAAIDRIRDAPRSCRVLMPPGIRAAGLRRFPFNVMFRERVGDIEILAVAAHRRHPSYWLGRVSVAERR